MMSSSNSYYRYLVENPNDLSSECFTRRKLKAQNNYKNRFCFEILNKFTDINSLKQFLKANLSADDIVIISENYFSEASTIVPNKSLYLRYDNHFNLAQIIKITKEHPAEPPNILFTPIQSTDLKHFVKFYLTDGSGLPIYWRFEPYDSNIENSITVSDIVKCNVDFKPLPDLEIINTSVPKHYELEPETNVSYKIDWSYTSIAPAPLISIVIPTFNNALFLTNVVWHLINQNLSPDKYEVIIADDGSWDNSSEIINDLISNHEKKINLKYIYWSKKHPQRGDQYFFRSGLARNLATRYSQAEYLLFLDSDMLVPENFVEVAIDNLKKYDLIQFQRFHINQELSKKNPAYSKINLKTDTYIEETHYWSQLFFANKWSSLSNYWKYTCTYALGLKRSQFLKLGMFKKYYISYGFEDTDLGYEAHKQNFEFHLVKLPLLHLTAYDQMQYKNSFRKRVKLLRVTAELFYLQHLDRSIYELLGDYFRFQKPMKAFFRDIFS